MKQQQRIKTIITEAIDAGGVSKTPEARHDEIVNQFLETHDVVSIHCNTLVSVPLFNDDTAHGPALVTTIVYRA